MYVLNLLYVLPSMMKGGIVLKEIKPYIFILPGKPLMLTFHSAGNALYLFF